ncbi:bifunctional hydroxymethylpyrimidine kinase/phosphomethylpyrimidine kinase [Methylomagnum sp.]
MTSTPPVVLCLSGHDPTGGAGIQADIETLWRLGCYPCTVVTALTAQDTHNVRRVIPQAADDFLEQARLVLADMKVAAVKIGLLGSVDIVRAVAEMLSDIGRETPVVLDPILAAGGGRNLSTDGLVADIKTQLIPRATVLTPNTPEARKLTGGDGPDECARALLALGCPNVLLTGTHEDGPDVVNRWYRDEGELSYRWPRLPDTYHGSGCTLASAVAAGLARGLPMADAIEAAQRFTWAALSRGFRLGGGQLLPNRLDHGFGRE